MAHNIATINGKAAMAYQGDTPWHKLGTRMDAGAIDVGAALAAASLDWTVSLQHMFLADGREVPKKRAVVRDTDDAAILGTVSHWYKPIQYPDAFGIFQPAVEEFGLTIEAAGALGHGEKAWMLFRLPATLAPVAGDDVNGYGVAITGHDGAHAFEFRPTPIRVVCQNTLDAAIGRGGAKGRVFGISHIGNVAKQVDAATGLVFDVLAAMTETGRTFAAMAHTRMTAADVVQFIESVFPPAKDGAVSDKLAERRQTVAELIWTGVGAELAMSETDGQPNAWAAYNAVTEYFDHVVTAASAKREAESNVSALFGAGAAYKLAALAQARELVAV
jgi:phage/plasmid-like protein (TIGR03299 family)